MEFHKYEENLNNEIRRAQACVKESNELIKDALEVNKEATASSIDKKLTALKITIDDSHEICSKLKKYWPFNDSDQSFATFSTGKLYFTIGKFEWASKMIKLAINLKPTD